MTAMWRMGNPVVYAVLNERHVFICPTAYCASSRLKANLKKQQTWLTKTEKGNVAVRKLRKGMSLLVTAIYKLSRMVVMSGKSYSERDFVKHWKKNAPIVCSEKAHLFKDTCNKVKTCNPCS